MVARLQALLGDHTFLAALGAVVAGVLATVGLGNFSTAVVAAIDGGAALVVTAHIGAHAYKTVAAQPSSPAAATAPVAPASSPDVRQAVAAVFTEVGNALAAKAG